MSTEQHEIEAYAKTSDALSLVSLLSAEIGELRTETPPGKELQIYKHRDITVVLQPGEDGFYSVWVRGGTPWLTSPSLGRYIAGNLRCVVRCDPEAEHPEVSPYSNIFLEIDGDRETLVAWG